MARHALYEQLFRQYPSAKVILTVRDPDRWYESARQTIYMVRNAFPRWLRRLSPAMARFGKMVDSVVWQGTFDGRFEDKPFAVDVFNRHNDRVQQFVPAGRLLVFDVREGSAPLCTFLELPVPEGKPFPHLNDAAEFQARIKRLSLIFRLIGFVAVAFFALILVGLAAIFFYR